MALTATVLGASGYSGGEVLRYLAGHPAIAVGAAAAGARAGRPVAGVHPHLAGLHGDFVSLTEALELTADVCFCCMPSGELGPHLARLKAGLVIDLSDEHRDSPDWVYGLTEFVGPVLASASRVANPGCYPTAALLALLPFARAGVIAGPLVVDALSGASGAGRKAEDRLLLATLDGNALAYGTTRHRHVPEMERALETLGGLTQDVSFTPHLVPMARGLLVTARARLSDSLTDEKALEILNETYERASLVEVVEEWPQTKAVSGSPRAQVSARVDERASWLIASAAIDNLGKGAAGQAIQNANLALGLEETAGLKEIGVWP